MYEDGYEDYDMVPYEGEECCEEEQLRRQHDRRFYGETVSGVLSAVTEYARTLEREKTNRANVERKRKAAITVIRSERRVMVEYLKRRFGERGSLYDRYFKLVDAALQVENEEILRIALESIQSIYHDGPCGGIGEFRRQFDSMGEAIRI